VAAEALCEAANSGLYDGYAASAGLPSCRAAVAGHFSQRLPPGRELSAADVYMTHGASGALSLALGALANQGVNVLLPRPGFPL
jgi:tyrosine aminotransferase